MKFSTRCWNRPSRRSTKVWGEMDLRSWCLPRVKGNTKGRVKSPIKSGSSVAKTENGTITSRCCRSYSRSLNHSHLWRARMMVASVSEWHLWIRFCPRQETNLLQVAVTLFSDCVVKDRSSWSSFLRLFSCAELESHDEAGSLLLDAGPPTWEIKMILNNTFIFTTLQRLTGWITLWS